MSTLSAAAGTWDIDTAHTNLGFSARHAMVAKVRGHFAEYSGTFTIDGENIANSKAELTIQAASILTGQADRDGHLKSPDFLDVENHPTLKFVSTSVRDFDGEEFVLVGDLTIRGTTQQVELAVEYLGETVDAYGGTRAGFSATTSISRKAYGVSFEAAFGAGNAVVADKVEIALELEFVKDAA